MAIHSSQDCVGNTSREWAVSSEPIQGYRSSVSQPRATFSDWQASWLLLIAYLALFHAWLWLPRMWVVLTGVVGPVVLVTMLLGFAQRGYFANTWDLAFHLVVVSDLLFESLFVKLHEGYSFYGCALGFGLVVGGYRFLRKFASPLPPPGRVAG